MVIYFTGTSNSRFAAETIAEITGDKLYDSALSLKDGTPMSFEDEDTLVFVCPIYVSTLPEPFERLIRRSTFKKNAKAYFFVTYAGSIGAAGRFSRNICKDKDLMYMGTTGVIMPQNYIAYFAMKTEEENRKIVETSLKDIQAAGEIIKLGQPFADCEDKISHYFIAKLSMPLFNRFYVNTKKFHVTDECIGCGKCARVCPLGNITMKDKIPVWGDKCTHCMGCINLCPKEAVEFGKSSLGKPRYHGPSV